jgi:hypothetical protein
MSIITEAAVATAGMVVGSNGTAAACTSTVARNADGVAASVLAPWPSVECWRPCCPTLHRRFTIYRRQTFSHRPTKPRRRPFIPHLDIHRASIIHRGETLTPRTESRDNRTARNTRHGGTYPAPKGTRQACERGPLAALGMSQLGLSPGRPGRRERQDDPRIPRCKHYPAVGRLRLAACRRRHELLVRYWSCVLCWNPRSKFADVASAERARRALEFRLNPKARRI